jgi:hypothetical protein
MTPLQDSLNKIKWLTLCASRSVDAAVSPATLATLEARFKALDTALNCVYKIKRELIRISHITAPPKPRLSVVTGTESVDPE